MPTPTPPSPAASPQPPVHGDKGASFAQSHQSAIHALERIEKLGLRPLPPMYELWYRYFQGDPDIVRAIDAHKGTLDEAACFALFNKHLNESGSGESLKQISTQVQQAISQIARMVSSAKDAATDYTSSLGNVEEQISNADSLSALGEVVSALVEDTRKMVEKNRALEVQLVNSSQQVTDLQQNLDTVRKESLTDGLTGLANRKAFDTQIRECVDAANAESTPLVLMMLDIDHFKKFNDTYGHQVGDQVLRLVGKTLIDNVKGRDVTARFGGEEFAIILPETAMEAGVKVGEILRRMVESKELINRANQSILGRITLSVGVAQYKTGESVSDFIERADAALYQAKHHGRNRVEISA